MLCGKVFFTAGPPVRVYLFRSSLSRFCINGSISSQSHLPQMQSADWSASCGPPHIASTSTHMYLSAPHRESGTLPAVRRGPASNPPPASVLQKIPQNPVYPGIFPSRKQLYACPRCCFPYFLQIPSNPQPSCYCSLPEKIGYGPCPLYQGGTADPAFSRKTGPYTGPAFSWRRPRLPGDGFQQ